MTLKTTKTKLYENKEGKTQEKDEAVLEKEISKLEKELSEEKKALSEEKRTEAKEKLKEIYQSELKKEKTEQSESKETEGFKKEYFGAGTGAAAPPAKTKIQKQVSDDTGKIKKMDQKNQVKALIKLVFAKNLAYAVKVARNLDSPYVLDEFHDTLVDEYYKEMVEKKKLKKI